MTTTRLSSWLLLGGILAGFLGATWQGHQAAADSKPDNFRRFHQRISPDTAYYPPYAMLEKVALDRWSPGKTLVIIGGNSVLNGVGQSADELWSLHLQELLGDSYVVVNLAFRGAYPFQAGALVAESLLLRGIPVLYVANTSPAASTGRAPGNASGYLYWQALFQHKLAGFPARDERIGRWLDALPAGERQQQTEERLGARLEAWFRPQSLWHDVGYRHFFTVWNFALRGDSFVPRAGLPDSEPPGLPLENRFQDNLTQEMAIVRSFSAGQALPGANGEWQPEPGNRQRLVDDIAASVEPRLRPRTLVLLVKNAPYYFELLSPAEQARDNLVYSACAQTWHERGMACAVVGADFIFEDYIDRSHLSPGGGRKLAEFVARQITGINHP